MTRNLARHLGLRLLALVMSGVFLAPKVIHAYDISSNNNVRSLYHKASRFAETNALIPFFLFDRFASLLCMSLASRVCVNTNNGPAIGDRMMEMGSRT